MGTINATKGSDRTNEEERYGISSNGFGMLLVVAICAAIWSILLVSVFADVAIDRNAMTAEELQVSSDLAFGYFGDLTVPQGSSVLTGVAELSSIADIEVVDVPRGIQSRLVDGSQGLLVEVAADSDLPTGQYDIAFEIRGEALPVIWTVFVSEPWDVALSR